MAHIEIKALEFKKHKNLNDLKNALRNDGDVVGIWDNMTSDTSGIFYHRITFQYANEDNRLNQVIMPRDGGEIKFLKGQLVYRRGKFGKSQRREVFVAESGKEMDLGIREF